MKSALFLVFCKIFIGQQYKKICVHLVYINVGIQFPSSPISARKMPAAICQ